MVSVKRRLPGDLVITGQGPKDDVTELMGGRGPGREAHASARRASRGRGRGPARVVRRGSRWGHQGDGGARQQYRPQRRGTAPEARRGHLRPRAWRGSLSGQLEARQGDLEAWRGPRREDLGNVNRRGYLGGFGMVRPGRFERPTSSFAGKRSIQLSYGRLFPL